MNSLGAPGWGHPSKVVQEKTRLPEQVDLLFLPQQLPRSLIEAIDGIALRALLF
jgi:hypothetical protein